MSKDDKTEEFTNAVAFIQDGPKTDNLTNEVKLKFYGYFKQATTGPCNEAAPSRLKIVQRMKWDAWNKLGKISKVEAKKLYISELDKLVPKWRDWKNPKAKL